MIYPTGYHDVVARDYIGLKFGHVGVESKFLNVVADGHKLVAQHGDLFGGITRHTRWLVKGAREPTGCLWLSAGVSAAGVL